MTASKNLDPSKLRFIAMDMDGTILDEGYQLSPHVADTLKKLQNQGKKLIIATGRIYKAAKIVLADSFEPDAFVCTNGADIYNRDGTILASHHIPTEALPILTKVSRDHDVLFCCCVGERWIYDRYSPGVDFYEKRTSMKGVRKNFDSLVGEDILKFLAVGPNEKLLEMRETILNSAPDLLDAFFSHETMLEIVASGVSKRQGLEECLRYLGGSLEETIAFGDAENDLEMLRSVKVGVAMGNAHSYIQTAVPYVTASVDDDGVARFLEELFGI